ncbi:beta and beta-prime subunits of DNA dependent RNA-polymerase [Neoconidiobolus thromboides FSU 785]|nr:beta and beta-prime subunits of DNA dependent RNA-polymerase [Neoconidiobolus thromboides FSU 785]
MNNKFGFTPSPAPVRRVKGVQFGILSPEEIKAMSVVQVVHPYVMDESGHAPRQGGLSDPRMGTIDRNFKCLSCGESMKECPGHFGHIEFLRPVFHPGFITKVKKVLECVCIKCGRLKADEENISFKKALSIRNPKNRFKAIWDICKGKSMCGDARSRREGGENIEGSENLDTLASRRMAQMPCGSKQPIYRKESLRIYAHYKAEKGSEESADVKELITASKVINIFKKISEVDLITMGLSCKFARPEWYMISVLPVPPPPVRPSISIDGSGRGEDDLTHKLGDIIKANDQLKGSEVGAHNMISDELEFVLQYHTATMMDNDIAGVPAAIQKSGRPIKSIRARLKGKEGRLRGNLMGKRVDFSARTVITGDPNLSIEQVGVPRSIARNLTYPETVTAFNMNRLQKAVNNGPNVHPGAKYVMRDTGERVDLRYVRNGNVSLQIGYVVERHINDGDVVIFNRQPSLHKMSMMGHRIKVLPFSTFRLNLSVTSPYNADFDGDEMNMHVPQSEESRAEILELCMVPKQIVSPQANKPVMGIVQDTLCGIRKFTKRDCFVGKELLMNLLLHVPDWDGRVPQPCIHKPIPLWTGKQVFSLIIPKGVNLTSFHSAHPDDEDSHISLGDTRVEIVGGDLVTGIVCKRTIGSSNGGLIHVVMNDFGSKVCMKLFNGTQTVVNYWLLQHGFSIGVGDMIADHATMTTINSFITKAKKEVKQVIREANNGKLEALPGLTVPETFESKVTNILNSARDGAGKAAERSLPEFNNIKQMVVAGSKGSFINISQMAACVGQQNVEGKRIPFGFRNRTLPHFTKNDRTPFARGFVENSYIRGLTPQEFFFHAMGGREGLIDTAVKTAETGYIQRRLVKAMEDVMVKYDGTVRNALGQVVQFCYGEDGMDAAFIEKQKIETVRMSNAEFNSKYKLDIKNGVISLGKNRNINTQLMGTVMNEPDIQVLLEDEFKQIYDDRKELKTKIFPGGDDNWPMPVNIRRLIRNAQIQFECSPHKPFTLHPVDVIVGVKKLLDSFTVIRGHDHLSDEANKNATYLFKILVRSLLASKKVVGEYHLTPEAFDYVIKEIQRKFYQAQAHPGEMVGTLAAQSIGEPATQMTLNTFHLAGVSNNTTTGVPRLKEIINVATNLKTPSMTISLKEEYSSNFEKAKAAQSQLEHCNLARLAERTEIYFDPELTETNIEADEDWIQELAALSDPYLTGDYTKENLSCWVLRIEFNPQIMLGKALTLEGIADHIHKKYNNQVFAYYPSEVTDQLVIHCRVVTSGGGDSNNVSEMDDDDVDETGISDHTFLRRLESSMLDEITLLGVPDISRVFIQTRNTPYISDDGSFKRREEYFLETSGTNLLEVLSMDVVNMKNTFSNNIVEILEVLGIEAARNSILRELRHVIEGGGSYVNYRHLSLLCDIMTSRGSIMAITRHGINRTESSALMRCSFEETVEILLEAAASGDYDECTGISENILLGQIAPLGTGSFDLLLDETMLNQVVIPNNGVGASEYNGASLYSGSVDYSAQMTPLPGNNQPRFDSFDGSSPITAQFSPMTDSGSFGYSPGSSPGAINSPVYSPRNPNFGNSASSPGYSPTSPSYIPGSPKFSPASPSFNPGSSQNTYRPTSPVYSGAGASQKRPFSPTYNPTSPSYNAGRGDEPDYSPTSPSYTPTSPRGIGQNSAFSPIGGSSFGGSKVGYSPTSPSYTPTSPSLAQGSNAYSPTSPTYSPSSPSYSANPTAQPRAASPLNAPRVASYSPTSPSFAFPAPSYSPQSPSFTPISPAQHQQAPSYSPTSPNYAPTSPFAFNAQASNAFAPSTSGPDMNSRGNKGKYSSEENSEGEADSSGRRGSGKGRNPDEDNSGPNGSKGFYE